MYDGTVTQEELWYKFALLIYEKKIYMWKGDIILIPSQPDLTLFP
jgi:hypothetical protein